MKKFILVIFFCSLFSTFIFSEEPPIYSQGWHWDSYTELNGKYFYYVYNSYLEQEGYAYIEGIGKVHYWLYDTYTYHNGDAEDIINKYIPAWIESMGFTIDFDHISQISPNNDLASSVKALMKQRNCDVSVTIIISSYNSYVVLNSYDKSNDEYFTITYPLIK